ncbi:MAG: DNA repair protein RecN, partial [Lachnospiraceae bacterium]|nr:DNA repair protein RecN [Lachnospiraceae bacterium]
LASVNAALGAGSFKDFVAEGAVYARVELTFETDSEAVRQKLEEAGLPDLDGIVVISRNYRNGRSVSRINGETVTAALVREVAALLIDIHGQHEHQSLLYPKYHLALVDSYAVKELTGPKKDCADAFRVWSEVTSELKEASLDEKDRLKQIDFLTYEISEIDEAALSEGEDESLEAQFRKLSHAQRIQEVLGEVSELTGSDSGAAMSVSRTSGRLGQVADLDEGLKQLSDMLIQIEDLCSDFSHSLSGYIDDFTYDEEEYRQISDRLDLINRLKSKYGRIIGEILQYRDRQQEALDRLTDYDAYVGELKKKQKESRERLKQQCEVITGIRKRSASQLQQQIIQSLEELNFLDVRFEISFEKTKEPSANGEDMVTFLISTNPGSPVRPLQNVASGGELSRIMLGIKTIMARRDSIQTLIFDEIDTGISGRTAQRVSEKMAQLSQHCQVIAITHLAQIAAMADHHYLIEKAVENGMTHTHVRELEEQEMVEELARILGGASITEAVLASAAEMKQLAGGRKSAG